MSKTEKIYQRLFKNRLSESIFEKDWRIEDRLDVLGLGYKNLKERIEYLISQNHVVTAGYLTTQIRNYHTHYILWRERKSK